MYTIRSVHYAIFEAALATELGIPVTEIYDAIINEYHNSQEVVELFTDLKKDWVGEFPVATVAQLKMVTPFKVRETLHNDFTLAAAFAEMGALTTMVGVEWKKMSYAFLLKKKLLSHAPTEIDVVVARDYLFSSFTRENHVHTEVRSWSSDVLWQKIDGEPQETPFPNIPQEWWDSFKVSTPDVERIQDVLPTDTGMQILGKWDAYAPAIPLRLKVLLKENAEESGMLDVLIEIAKQWTIYTTAYESIKS